MRVTRLRLAATGALCAFGIACGGGGGKTVTSLTSLTLIVPSGTLFIGNSVQLDARETLSDGTTRPATTATWGSADPAIATVSSTGLVTAVTAGEATILADTTVHASVKIRVFPDFRGSWIGREHVTACGDDGAFEGICADPGFMPVGALYQHNSRFTQNDDSVTAVLDEGDGFTVTVTGTISVNGDLELPTGTMQPADPAVAVQVQHWRCRADVPARMTGSYEIYLTMLDVPGSVTVSIELQNVSRMSATSAAPSSASAMPLNSAIRRMAHHR